MTHDINDNEHRAECRACRKAFRAPNHPGYIPPKGSSPKHPHGSDPAPPRFDRCPNPLCKNPNVPEGTLAEHFVRYPKCNPDPLPKGWTANKYGVEGSLTLIHETCGKPVIVATKEQIPAKIAHHMQKRHAS
jgi:hypothetical protein